MSYIVNSKNEAIAYTVETLKSGTEVQFGFETSKEAIDANYERRLVNAQDARISNAKRYAGLDLPLAVDIHDGERAGMDFLVGE